MALPNQETVAAYIAAKDLYEKRRKAVSQSVIDHLGRSRAGLDQHELRIAFEWMTAAALKLADEVCDGFDR